MFGADSLPVPYFFKIFVAFESIRSSFLASRSLLRSRRSVASYFLITFLFFIVLICVRILVELFRAAFKDVWTYSPLAETI